MSQSFRKLLLATAVIGLSHPHNTILAMPPSGSMGIGEPANLEYSYTIDDINCFLQENFDTAPWVSVVPGVNRRIESNPENEIIQRLRVEKEKMGDSPRFILMPYENKLSEFLAVCIIKEDKAFKGIIIPATLQKGVTTDIKEVLLSIYGDTFSAQVLQGYYVAKECSKDQGVVTLGNLLVFGFQGGISLFPISSTLAFRSQHIQTSTSLPGVPRPFHLNEFYDFPKRQADNFPIVTYSAPDGHRYQTRIRPFTLTISYEDLKKFQEDLKTLKIITETCKKLPRDENGALELSNEKHRADYNHVVGYFPAMFNNLDGSIVSPVSFGLQLHYKEIPWHLISLHYWQFSTGISSGLKESVFNNLLSNKPERINGLQSLYNLLDKVSKLQKLEKGDLFGLNILKPFWEYSYITSVLRDLNHRISCITKDDSWTNRIGVFRVLQLSGEYFNKLKHILFFKTLLKSLDLNGFRNIFSHLENLQYTVQSILTDNTLNWREIYKEVNSFGAGLKSIEILEDILQEENIAALRQGSSIRTLYFLAGKIKSISTFPEIKKLRKKISEANPSLQKEKPSITLSEAEQISRKLSPDPEQQEAIKKVLSEKKIDKSEERRLHEYVEFIRALHNQGVAFDQEEFWNDLPTYSEILFNQMRGHSLADIDTPVSKKNYQLSLLNKAIDLIDWVRGLLGVSDINLSHELTLNNGLYPEAREGFAISIINSAPQFNTVLTPLTDERLRQFVEENPCGLSTLEFLIGASYEALRPIFYFPIFEKHYLHNLQVRNYYAHPDPTYRTPFIVWQAQSIASWDGRRISTRPDRNNQFQEVLLQEASRLLVPLHYVLIAKREELRLSLAEDEETGNNEEL